jgi:hypothetical protein
MLQVQGVSARKIAGSGPLSSSYSPHSSLLNMVASGETVPRGLLTRKRSESPPRLQSVRDNAVCDGVVADALEARGLLK